MNVNACVNALHVHSLRPLLQQILPLFSSRMTCECTRREWNKEQRNRGVRVDYNSNSSSATGKREEEAMVGETTTTSGRKRFNCRVSGTGSFFSLSDSDVCKHCMTQPTLERRQGTHLSRAKQ